MQMQPSHRSATRELRELLLVFVNCILTRNECRCATLGAGLELSAVVFKDLFEYATEAAFLDEVEAGRFRLSEAGAAVVAAADLRSTCGLLAHLARTAQHSPGTQTSGLKPALTASAL